MTSELDPLDERLAAAGRLRELDPDARQALQDLVEAAAPRGGRRGVRRLLVPASAGAGALVLATAGAVAATQWGPWTYVPEPDIVIARDWTAVDGSELGSCRTHLVTENLDDETLAAARAYFADLDVDAIEPDAEHVASMLTGAGRLERLGQLIEGADVDDYDVTHTGPIWTDAFLSDAWILQSGLTTAVYKGLSERLTGDDPDLVDTLAAHMEKAKAARHAATAAACAIHGIGDCKSAVSITAAVTGMTSRRREVKKYGVYKENWVRPFVWIIGLAQIRGGRAGAEMAAVIGAAHEYKLDVNGNRSERYDSRRDLINNKTALRFWLRGGGYQTLQDSSLGQLFDVAEHLWSHGWGVRWKRKKK